MLHESGLPGLLVVLWTVAIDRSTTGPAGRLVIGMRPGGRETKRFAMAAATEQGGATNKANAAAAGAAAGRQLTAATRSG